mgnify:CR=1 FL=1
MNILQKRAKINNLAMNKLKCNPCPVKELFLDQLSVVNYRNLTGIDFSLDRNINCFVGDNGVGKTNALDAIYFLAMGKSYSNSITSQNISHQADFSIIEGVFDKSGKSLQIQCHFEREGKKTIKRNRKAYKKIADHVGVIPVVIISPTDRDLISEGSSVRRKFLDRTISQSNKSYLQNLLAYQRILNQRNALLKHFASSNQFDKDTLSVFNEKLVQFGQPIYQARKKFVEAFQPLFQDRYQFISGGKEVVSIGYESKIGDNNFEILLEESLQKDRILQYTSIGPHKDDLHFQINNFPIKKFGSQGQQKTFLIALKLAQFDVIRNQMNVLPILLLDDIFDKLDDYRVMQIINLVNDDSFGQLFVTDTNKERTENIIKQTAQSYSMFSL